jgi:hypothetical protein
MGLKLFEVILVAGQSVLNGIILSIDISLFNPSIGVSMLQEIRNSGWNILNILILFDLDLFLDKGIKVTDHFLNDHVYQHLVLRACLVKFVQLFNEWFSSINPTNIKPLQRECFKSKR